MNAAEMPPRRPAHARGGPWRGVSLTTRILAVNVIVLALIAFSLLYIDSYRREVLGERFKRASGEAEIAAEALAQASGDTRAQVLTTIGRRHALRLRLYRADGSLEADSFLLAPPSFHLADPATQPWYMQSARLLDRGMDAILGAPEVPAYVEPPAPTHANDWPEVIEARRSGQTAVREHYAPDRTPIINAATPVGRRGQVLLVQQNARDVTQSVRDARQTLAIVVAIALLLTVYLSLFLARTIVQPLRLLVRASVRVRLGRDRTVVVPRLPDRGDEIGLLARALSDMTEALRTRMDGVDRFAADVAHEIKNPLASLRSALESLDKIDDLDLRRQLMDIANHDVQRMDRLISEIAEASRIDAELARSTFEPVNLRVLAEAMVGARGRRGANRDCRLLLHHIGNHEAVVAGVATRLERVLENLLDNAVSFSPPHGAIRIEITGTNEHVVVEIRDEGPGIPPQARERVFERFHSLRPAGEDFGAHSGLGLAIARTIIEGHDGTLTARDPLPGERGARLVIELPTYHQEVEEE
ncbi:MULTISPECIES: sensor histidine kinase [unclassified Novosphingobium]|uniref:sensor histidine kinase n=1 Tax=unclassified Novosphingobium TaxID=2644732 RepID=UPI00086C4675|nr:MULTISPECIES: ATP-binding protein [unclassified Novosphingobium]MBN9143817.1 sensor N-terminal transmembrane domain-containing protein [Novosphingobium sp.]MDR6707003.1 two-component system sensor histidine kinase ChvG [Novosphingobium sp. 1748]NKJ02101.1 two-component system sensor histidine kinase ChvG [Novosphingobium sp. SG707]ODU84415.1 MAG: histidine kinase [Novosphingobium sp. SCN 63-17]OJX92955.1 MAG: sensor histidine kinase [Novosphingobium sp. 63-713]